MKLIRFIVKLLWFTKSIDATRQAFDLRLNVLEEKVSSLEEKFNNLEEKVDSRLRETKPIWESVLESLKIMDAKFDVIGAELLDLRAETQLLKRKLPPAAWALQYRFLKCPTNCFSLFVIYTRAAAARLHAQQQYFQLSELLSV